MSLGSTFGRLGKAGAAGDGSGSIDTASREPRSPSTKL